MEHKINLDSLKQIDLARFFNKNERTIQRWHEQGLPRHGEGKGCYYVWAECRQFEQAKMGGLSQAEDGPTDKERLLKAEADMAEMKRDQMEGGLLDAEEARRAWVNECMTVRGRLLTLPSTAAVRLMDGQTQAEREEVIKALVYEALEELSGGAKADEV